MRILVLTLFPLAVWAQPTSVGILGATSTSIVFSYQAPDSNPCTIVASESSISFPPS